MKKLILLLVIFGSYMFADIHRDGLHLKNQSNIEQYSGTSDITDNDFKSDAGRRRGKGYRGDRRRGGGGLR